MIFAVGVWGGFGCDLGVVYSVEGRNVWWLIVECSWGESIFKWIHKYHDTKLHK